MIRVDGVVEVVIWGCYPCILYPFTGIYNMNHNIYGPPADEASLHQQIPTTKSFRLRAHLVDSSTNCATMGLYLVK